LKKYLLITAALLAIITAGACSSSPHQSDSSGRDLTSPSLITPTYIGSPPMTTYAPSKTIAAPAPTITTGGTASSITSAPAYGSSSYTTDTSLPSDRMIVRTGNISMVVNDVTGALANIVQIAGGLNGYVVSSNTWKDGENVYGSITIRVPADSYDSASNSVTQIAVDVTSQSSSSQDVTEEYVDLGAQLDNLKATEAQLLLIMAKAEKVEDILAVQAQLTQVQSQIEQIQGRMQYLEKTSATSLINISLAEAKLSAKFSASAVNAKTGETIQFNPQIAGGFTPYSYTWDFGDGKTSTDSNPQHSFAKPGKYTITLKVTDDRANTVTETRTDYITITQGGWSAAGVASGAWGALLWLGRGLVSAVIGLAIFSPVIIIIAAAVWLLRRRRAKTA
jgi:PKD repeat protein